MRSRLAATEEMRLFGESIGQIARSHVAPQAEALDMHDDAPPGKLASLLDEQGLALLAAPEGLGGAGGGIDSCLVACEQLASASAAVAMPFALAQAAVMGLLAGGEPGHAILTELGDARPVLVDGAKSLRVEAGEPGWTLAGEVSHTYGARWAALAVVVAADRDGELALHGVWLDDARVAVEPAEQRTGLRGSGAARLRFDDAPAVRSIVDPEAAMRASRYLELACAAIALGTAAGALDAAIAYMRERRQFGQALTDFPALRAMVGSRALELEAGGLHILEAALREDALGEAGDPHVAAATESAMRAAWAAVDDAVQLHGGYGYVREYGVERRMRDVTSLRARAGAAHRRHARVAEPPMLPARS